MYIVQRLTQWYEGIYSIPSRSVARKSSIKTYHGPSDKSTYHTPGYLTLWVSSRYTFLQIDSLRHRTGFLRRRPDVLIHHGYGLGSFECDLYESRPRIWRLPYEIIQAWVTKYSLLGMYTRYPWPHHIGQRNFLEVKTSHSSKLESGSNHKFTVFLKKYQVRLTSMRWSQPR